MSPAREQGESMSVASRTTQIPPSEDGSPEMAVPQLALLSAIQASNGPIGTREARRFLSARGLDLSESTISRRLRDLDDQGLTIQLGGKGRILTEVGEKVVAEAIRTNEQEELLRRASKVDTVDDVLNLLRARRAVEPEATREAAGRATAADIETLRTLVTQHDHELSRGNQVPRALALDFHRKVSGLSKNPLLQATLHMVLGNSFDRLEAALDVVLQAHHAGQHSVHEHSRIVDAISQGDGAKAERLMRDHLSRLVDEIEEFIAAGNGDIFNRLLTWKS